MITLGVVMTRLGFRLGLGGRMRIGLPFVMCLGRFGGRGRVMTEAFVRAGFDIRCHAGVGQHWEEDTKECEYAVEDGAHVERTWQVTVLRLSARGGGGEERLMNVAQ